MTFNRVYLAWLGLFVLTAECYSAEIAKDPVPKQMVIVVSEPTALRASASERANQQMQLHAGDVLEVRGERLDYLQVYNYRQERAGFVRADQVRWIPHSADKANEILAIVDFLADSSGSESLGIGYVAAYLQAVDARELAPDVFAALGKMAERLARRANSHKDAVNDELVAAQLEVAEFYGVHMQRFEREQRIQVCYDGEAFRRVLALPTSRANQAQAALALTRADCINPDLNPLARADLNAWRLAILQKAEPVDLPGYLKNRLNMRLAGVWASQVFERQRRNESAAEVVLAAQNALDALAAVNKNELTNQDNDAYAEAATRVGAIRWAAQVPTSGRIDLFASQTANSPADKKSKAGAKQNQGVKPAALSLELLPGQPGETCLLLWAKQVEVVNSNKPAEPLLRHCTFATIWSQSAVVNSAADRVILAVTPQDAWQELWVLSQNSEGWSVHVLPPANEGLDIGYVEFAGWVPGSEYFLVARETRLAGRFTRSFEQINLANLDIEKRADKPEALSVFYRWQDPAWKRQTLSLR